MQQPKYHVVALLHSTTLSPFFSTLCPPPLLPHLLVYVGMYACTRAYIRAVFLPRPAWGACLHLPALLGQASERENTVNSASPLVIDCVLLGGRGGGGGTLRDTCLSFFSD